MTDNIIKNIKKDLKAQRRIAEAAVDQKAFMAVRERVSFEQPGKPLVDAKHPFERGAVGNYTVKLDGKAVGSIAYRSSDGNYVVRLKGSGNAIRGFGESVPEAAISAIEALVNYAA